MTLCGPGLKQWVAVLSTAYSDELATILLPKNFYRFSVLFFSVVVVVFVFVVVSKLRSHCQWRGWLRCLRGCRSRTAWLPFALHLRTKQPDNKLACRKNHKYREDENGTNLQWWNWHNAKIAKQKLNELIRCESKICYFEHDHLHRNNIFKVYQGYRNLNNNKWVDLMQIPIGFEKLCKNIIVNKK